MISYLPQKSTRLWRIIEDWHLEYHSEEKEFTPTSLVEAADKKCKALRKSNQLYTTTDSEVFIMEATLKQHTPPHPGRTTSSQGKTGGTHRPPKPAWYNSPPTHMNQTHRFDDRYWCPKCGTGGKWVCTHTPDKHQDNFVKKRKSETVTPDHSATAPPTAVGKIAAPLPSNQPNPTITSADIAKLVVEQVATQFHAHIASLQNITNAPAPADEDTIHVLPTDW